MALDTRRRILDASWRLLRERAEGARIEDVAEEAGISRQALYKHFPDRARLLVETARHIDEQLGLEEATRPVREARNPAEMLDRMAEFLGHYPPRVYDVAFALEAVRKTDAAANAALDDRHRLRRRRCITMARSIARQGMLAPGLTVDDAAGLLMAISSLPFWHELTQGCRWSKRRFVTQVQRLLRNALLRNGPVTARGSR